jgi:hypothetical protein
MLVVAQMLAFSSAILLVTSIAIWAGLLRGPLLQRLDGSRAVNVRPAELAVKALALAVGVSALAALLAIVGWVFG